MLKLVTDAGAQAGENIRYVAPTSAYDGMPVFAPLKAEGRIGLVPCKVLTAMGDTARVVCEDPKIDTWYRLTELRVPEQEPKP